MDRFLITGGKKLSGMVRTDGSKNAALPIIVASLLIDEGETVLENIPPLRDIKTISQVLENLGATIDYDARAMRMIINASDIT
ncbi:MAG TPA: UDP-N-acetylglucosamine 1-carboxyvinyltransferase, partial [candidate division Zixibacteria bacterium]|nr:UDP-N-acetylglucosamine 1-carboxyvinyltransferase [candidate division Zixibacteria bacterium]